MGIRKGGKRDGRGGNRVDAWAVTQACGESEMIESGYSPRAADGSRVPITFREWCLCELARLRRKGDTHVRLAEGHGYIWITRAAPTRAR